MSKVDVSGAMYLRTQNAIGVVLMLYYGTEKGISLAIDTQISKQDRAP
jgi:hypothetical protein